MLSFSRRMKRFALFHHLTDTTEHVGGLFDFHEGPPVAPAEPATVSLTQRADSAAERIVLTKVLFDVTLTYRTLPRKITQPPRSPQDLDTGSRSHGSPRTAGTDRRRRDRNSPTRSTFPARRDWVFPSVRPRSRAGRHERRT